MARYRVAIIGGAGSWGQHYLNAYANHPQCEIVGLVDPMAQRRDPLAEYYGVRACYDAVEELLDVMVPDIVSVIVPTAHNPGIVLACMEAGVKAISCEKPMAMSLQEADSLVATSERLGVAFGVGSLLADHRIRRIGRWIAEGNLGEIQSVGIYSGTMGNVSGGAAPRFATFRILTNLDATWAEGTELERRYTGYPERDRSEEVDGPVCGRIGLENGLVCEIPDPDETDLTERGIWVEGSGGCVSVGKEPKVVLGKGAQSRDVTDEVAGPALIPARYTFIPLISKLIRALDEGLELRPSGDDARFALEAAIGLKQSAACGGDRIDLPIPNRDSLIHPHPYQAFGGDVAGYQSLFPKYKAPSFERHIQGIHITESRHSEALKNREI